jgi:hypothetical protein
MYLDINQILTRQKFSAHCPQACPDGNAFVTSHSW